MIKNIFLALICALFIPAALSAQKPSDRDRKAWMKEMQQYKVEFVTKKLKLTAEQKEKFLPLYNKMDEEVRSVADQTYRMARDVRKKGKDATELEQEKAAEALWELKGKEAAIEIKYMKQFKKVLTAKQLIALKRAENDFSRELMNHHRTSKNSPDKNSSKPKPKK